jgi:hypothetical protein
MQQLLRVQRLQVQRLQPYPGAGLQQAAPVLLNIMIADGKTILLVPPAAAVSQAVAAEAVVGQMAGAVLLATAAQAHGLLPGVIVEPDLRPGVTVADLLTAQDSAVVLITPVDLAVVGSVVDMVEEGDTNLICRRQGKIIDLL